MVLKVVVAKLDDAGEWDVPEDWEPVAAEWIGNPNQRQLRVVLVNRELQDRETLIRGK